MQGNTLSAHILHFGSPFHTAPESACAFPTVKNSNKSLVVPGV